MGVGAHPPDSPTTRQNDWGTALGCDSWKTFQMPELFGPAAFDSQTTFLGSSMSLAATQRRPQQRTRQQQTMQQQNKRFASIYLSACALPLLSLFISLSARFCVLSHTVVRLGKPSPRPRSRVAACLQAIPATACKVQIYRGRLVSAG